MVEAEETDGGGGESGHCRMEGRGLSVLGKEYLQQWTLTAYAGQRQKEKQGENSLQIEVGCC